MLRDLSGDTGSAASFPAALGLDPQADCSKESCCSQTQDLMVSARLSGHMRKIPDRMKEKKENKKDVAS